MGPIVGGPGLASGVAIAAVGLIKRYGRQVVLDDVDLEVREGEIIVVVGPSGSGKSTLLRIIAGLERPDSGRLRLWDRPVDGVPPQCRDLGVVFQERALFRHLTVEGNVAFGLEVRGAPRERVARRVDRMLELVGLAGHRRALPDRLSAGERQLVALARALAPGPRALLLDEPFNALDAATRVELRGAMRQLLHDTGTPALIVTHDQEEGLEMADRMAILNGGRVEQVGTPYAVYSNPANAFVAGFLGAANVLLGRWAGAGVEVGGVRLDPPPDPGVFEDGQPVKVIFRPEDVSVAFHDRFLDSRWMLGEGVVDRVAFVGATERVAVRLRLRPEDPNDARDTAWIGGLPILMARSKWVAADMKLETGDRVRIGVKTYRLHPHYPLRSETGARVLPG